MRLNRFVIEDVEEYSTDVTQKSCKMIPFSGEMCDRTHVVVPGVKRKTLLQVIRAVQILKQQL